MISDNSLYNMVKRFTCCIGMFCIVKFLTVDWAKSIKMLPFPPTRGPTALPSLSLICTLLLDKALT